MTSEKINISGYCGEREKGNRVEKHVKMRWTFSVVSAAGAARDGVVSSIVGGGTASPAPPAAGRAARGRASSPGAGLTAEPRSEEKPLQKYIFPETRGRAAATADFGGQPRDPFLRPRTAFANVLKKLKRPWSVKCTPSLPKTGLTLFYTRGLGIVVSHVMVALPYRFFLGFFT
jgi:hypothetical protein